ncbi:Gfo/Idh/MocA family oxidoreductase [Deinococcus peraridilitoris]|uniref:Putative dehydrogenase n=1 Tax=Deinococcus peraridilitoris (strain DSM 19664 / LMG 22246 / CIP 109416 / KR-200) TaxID=937777 RepID=L0A1G7_DEIPD|nr:Gfo/Idh/MocA family oxidoreductase [Deinococcus peraridilitoris]AFZ66855.1 putative dehydrogenase [Deinococcus peraridilitoris DSM 19664]
MERTLAVGVIGAGSMGARHARNLHQYVAGAQIAGLYDPDSGRAREVAASCGEATVFGDPLALIADSSIDAVLIASPDATHAELVHACLQHGKPVLCEKPLAVTAEGALKIVQAEQEIGRRLVGVGLMRRFDPQHLAVERALASGAVGRGLLFKGVHRNAKVPQHLPGEVVITNSAVHDIDSARWLLGQEVTQVFVSAVRTRDTLSADTRDMLLLQLQLTGGCLATIEVTVAADYGYEVSAEIVGVSGTVTTGLPMDAVIRSGRKTFTDVPADWLERFQEAYIDELAAWTHSVRSGQAFSGASAWDGYQALVVTDACILALKSAAAVAVPTPERPALYDRAVSPEVPSL